MLFFSTNMEEFELHLSRPSQNGVMWCPWFWMVSMHQHLFRSKAPATTRIVLGSGMGPDVEWENYGKWCLSKVLTDGISMDWNMLNLNGFNIAGNWREEGPKNCQSTQFDHVLGILIYQIRTKRRYLSHKDFENTRVIMEDSNSGALPLLCCSNHSNHVWNYQPVTKYWYTIS